MMDPFFLDNNSERRSTVSMDEEFQMKIMQFRPYFFDFFFSEKE